MAVDDTLFAMLLDAVDDEAVFMLDPRGRVLTWNRGAERVKGYGRDDVVGRSFEMFYLPADVIAGVLYDELDIAERCGAFEGDGWRLRADGRRFRAHTTLTAIRTPERILVGFARVTRDLTRIPVTANTDPNAIDGRPWMVVPLRSVWLESARPGAASDVGVYSPSRAVLCLKGALRSGIS